MKLTTEISTPNTPTKRHIRSKFSFAQDIIVSINYHLLKNWKVMTVCCQAPKPLQWAEAEKEEPDTGEHDLNYEHTEGNEFNMNKSERHPQPQSDSIE